MVTFKFRDDLTSGPHLSTTVKMTTHSSWQGSEAESGGSGNVATSGPTLPANGLQFADCLEPPHLGGLVAATVAIHSKCGNMFANVQSVAIHVAICGQLQ